MEAAVYLATLALFGFVVLGAARVRHELLLLACIPPVFVALVMGFVMGLYAADHFGWPAVCAALAVGGAAGWIGPRRASDRDLLIFIFLAWSIGLVLALIAFGFPDHE